MLKNLRVVKVNETAFKYTPAVLDTKTNKIALFTETPAHEVDKLEDIFPEYFETTEQRAQWYWAPIGNMKITEFKD